MNDLINEIKSKVISDYREDNFVNVSEYIDSVYDKDIIIHTPNGQEAKTVKIWTTAIQKALDENKNVYIPKSEDDIYIDNTIVVRSENKLKIDTEQKLILVPEAGVCMIRNENVISGTDKAVEHNDPDRNIVIEGGIWDSNLFDDTYNNGNSRLAYDKNSSIRGVLSIMLLSNIENIIIKNVTFTKADSYAVQLSNCIGFYINNITFIKYHKDGIHINGPVKYGIVSDLYGKNMGDDMIALNAWDWNSSAMSFGSIEKLLVENINSDHNEFRLLPGRKSYCNGEYIDCDIKDCVIRNVSGVYTFKLYAQPNIHDRSDCSEVVGNIHNVYFDNIKFPEISKSGFSNIPVNGLFEICTDTENIHIENIEISDTAKAFNEKNLSVIKVGPLSAVWTNNSENPDDWSEIFSPDDICTAKNTYIKNVKFADKTAAKEDIDVLIRTVRLTPNPDYPNTTPKGGSGYGNIENVYFENQ